MGENNNIVEGWLRSLNLVQYTQSFIDNGYDDLEVCKQIGELDLDAIGIAKKEHRDKLIRAVRILREEGGTAVYFTLEETVGAGVNPQIIGAYYDDSVLKELGPPPDPPELTDEQAVRLDAYDVGKSALLIYPKVQLKHILKIKIREDDIDLSSPPYTTQEFGLCRSSLTALAVKYADELKTHFEDVFERLEELWHIARELDSYTLPVNHSPMHGIYGSSSVYGFSPRHVPPPLPSIPPPSTSHVERCTDLQCHLQIGHRHDNYVHQNYVAVDGDPKGVSDEGKKKTSTLSRFLRNIGIRRSGKKHCYKQYSGDPKIKRDQFSVSGDPNAFDITMSDEERIALMVMVKEGKISTETALEVVRRFEDERLRDSNGSLVDIEGKENMGGYPINPSSKKKKNPGSKPMKSQSAIYADAGPRCHICQHVILAEEQEDNQHIINDDPDNQLYVCCRHKRVHSVGHIEFPHHVHSPLFTRAMSCSPSRNPNIAITSINTPDQGRQSPAHNRLYSPILAHSPKVMQPSLPQGMEAIKERLSGKSKDFMHKTTSRTSLLSSESDHSMECSQHGLLKSEVLTSRNDDTNYCSNSTVSMSSDNSPAIGRKKQELGVKGKGQKWHRSASYSTGDDGISSENDEHDNAHLLGAWSRDRNKLGGRLREMRFELKKKVMKNKDERPQHTHNVHNIQATCNNTQLMNVSRPPLLRTTSQGGYMPPPAPAACSQMPLYGCFQPSGEPAVYSGPFLGKAWVTKSFQPSEEEVDFLHIEKGDIIHIINMAQSGVWRGALKGQVGNFHFCNVEVIVDDAPLYQRKDKHPKRKNSKKSKPKSVEELMQRIGLEHLTSLLLLNGYDQLEIFSEIDEEDLNILNISDPEQRAKLLTAAELLLDFDSTDTSDSHVKSDNSGAASDTPCSLSPSNMTNKPSPTPKVSRDSGCFASSEQLQKHSTACKKSPLTTKTVPSGQGGLKGSNSSCKTCTNCGKPKVEGGDDSMDTDKSDREYTEEDREVSAITKCCGDTKVQNNPPRTNSCAKTSNYGYSQCQICKHNSSLMTSGVYQTASNGNVIYEGIYPRMMCQSVYGQTGQHAIYGKHKKTKPVPPPRISSAQDTSVYLDNRKATGAQSQIMSPSKHQSRSNQIMSNSQSFGCDTRSPPPNYKSTILKDGRKSVEPIYAASQKTLKNVSRSLIPLVTTKLGAEKIDFSLEPYSTQNGYCGIPPLLVQRYAEELRQDITSVALVLEQVRIIQLQSLDRVCIPNEKLAESCSEACDLKIASIYEFFISIGLPMYTEDIVNGGVTTIEQLLKTTESQFNQITGADSRHLKRLLHAIEWVRSKLSSPTRSIKTKAIINVIDKV
ncbi:hypothetical protein SNE40_005748 [Patella caerulea]|uniref:Sterile alpha motif domain-containing protein 5 n=1 Tax=Patella caerulea TaxID=87958 RepID=A0AAN8K489_PATCE